jgi:hypothetical protein
MSECNCRSWVCELVECARAQAAPSSELRQHLRECPACAARWASERNLEAHLEAVKEAAAARQPADAQRERIMRQFARMHRRTVHPLVRWALAAAAALVLATGVWSVWRGVAPPVSHPGQSAPGTGTWADAAEAEEPDAGEGFVAVPYAPPLAPGEFVRVVHAELDVVELARMGVLVDDFDTAVVPADMVVGEDGFPRAVRVWDDSQF